MKYFRTLIVAIVFQWMFLVNYVSAYGKICYSIEAIPNSHATLGEGPHWDIATQNLYYVNIVAATLLRYDFQRKTLHQCKIPGEEFASFVIPVEGTTNKFAVGCGRRVVIVTWDGIAETCNIERTLFEVQQDDKFKVMRINDGKCDPRGRLFAGTMRINADEAFKYRWGELFKWEKDGEVEVVKRDIGISNGLTWNEQLGKFYYIDSTDDEVKGYDYDFDTGVASNLEVVISFRSENPQFKLFPDGMTIDTDGNIYVAIYDGYTVFKINPRTGKVLLKIRFPCKEITSVAFGGPNLDVLFVTTATLSGPPDPRCQIYKVTGLGSTGLPMTKLQI